ncbi:MAG: S-layer homology domain-containing protein [Candidatus Saganbacteria bacterium]|nr:S-layer homology domain-containing protein [Candidatus Saganbacteria bacterium]
MKKYFQVFFGLIILSCFLLTATVSSADDVKFASDITRLGVGARPLGMGKMFVGLSDDISSIFLNPAGLADIDGHQALTMSGQFVNTVNYLTVAAATPNKWGSVGIGYAGANLGFDIPVLNLIEIATGEYRVVPSTTESVSYDYVDYAITFSYANTFWRPEVSLGASLKLFTERISGANSGDGQGMDIDVGALYKPNEEFTLGLTGKNILPFSMGGKMHWNTGLEEPVPASLIAGVSYTRPLGGGRVNLGLDYEMQPTMSNIPPFMHLGAEWWPLEIFAVRAGIDQDVVGTGTGTDLTVSSNPTAGLSLFVNNVRFDYAFHKYNDLSNNDTHYFSLAFLMPKRIPLTVFTPEDELLTHDNSVLVKGEVDDPEIKTLMVNGYEVKPDREGKFQQEISLMLGKNTIWVVGLNNNNEMVESKRLRVLRLIAFSDVPEDYWAVAEIEQLGTLNIMPGYSDGTFKPEQTTKRVDYLIRLLNIGKLPPATELRPFPFKDIDYREKIAPYIKSGWDNNLVKGYPDKTFKPWQFLNRVEGAVMTVRFSNFRLVDVLERPYLDIPARHWAIKEVATAKEHSMLKFALEYLYPKKELPRAELAAMLVYAPTVKVQVDELMDFETGYETSYYQEQEQSVETTEYTY